MAVFARSMFKGALLNLFAFVSNVHSTCCTSLPLNLKILQYQRKLYLQGMKDPNKKGNDGRDVLQALHKFRNIGPSSVSHNL